MQTLVAPEPAAPIARASEPVPAGSAILALDLGTTTGWAIRTAEGVILSGTVSFRPSQYDGDGMRYLRFRVWLEELAEDAGPLRGGEQPIPARGPDGKIHPMAIFEALRRLGADPAAGR